MRPTLIVLAFGVLLAACSAAPAPAPAVAPPAPRAAPAPASTAAACLGGGPFPPILSETQYGVNAFLLGTDAPRILTLANNASFGWVRQQIHWRDVEGERGRYVWAPVDQAVAQARAYGLSIMLSVVRSPAWADRSDGLPDDRAAFAGFMGALATRYRGQVAAYQVWNEPNLALENGGVPATPADYLAALKAAYPAIKAADPCALVIAAATAATSTGDRSAAIDDLSFLDQLYQADGGSFLRSADLVDLHPGGGPFAPDALWPSDRPDESARYFRHIERVRELMLRYHDMRQAWISEVGWATSAAPGAPAPVTPQQQADYLVAALRRVGAEYGWISGVFVWNLNFGVLGGPDDEKASFGILNHNWEPRPAYLALQNYLHGQARQAAQVRPTLGPGVPYRPAWSAGVTGKSHTAPLRAPDGTLYVGSDPGYLYAFAPTGGLIWRFTAPGGVRSAPARSPDGTLYVADDSGALSALSPEGTLLWQRELGASSAGSPLLLGGDIYLSVDHALLRIGSAGQTIWRSELGAAASPAALVRGPSGPLLAVGEADGWLAAVGLDGALRWRTQLAAPALAQPADDHAGGVLAGDAAGALHRLDAGSGAISWERPLVHPVQSDSLPPGGALIAAPPLVAADGTIYLGGRDGSLSALGPDGSLRWRYESGSDITATPTQLADGSVLVGLLDWRVVAVSPAGRARWEIRLNGAVRSTPLYDQAGDLYVSTVGGRIYSFSGGTTAGEPAPQS